MNNDSDSDSDDGKGGTEPERRSSSSSVVANAPLSYDNNGSSSNQSTEFTERDFYKINNLSKRIYDVYTNTNCKTEIGNVRNWLNTIILRLYPRVNVDNDDKMAVENLLHHIFELHEEHHLREGLDINRDLYNAINELSVLYSAYSHKFRAIIKYGGEERTHINTQLGLSEMLRKVNYNVMRKDLDYSNFNEWLVKQQDEKKQGKGAIKHGYIERVFFPLLAKSTADAAQGVALLLNGLNEYIKYQGNSTLPILSFCSEDKLARELVNILTARFPNFTVSNLTSGYKYSHSINNIIEFLLQILISLKLTSLDDIFKYEKGEYILKNDNLDHHIQIYVKVFGLESLPETVKTTGFNDLLNGVILKSLNVYKCYGLMKECIETHYRVIAGTIRVDPRHNLHNRVEIEVSYIEIGYIGQEIGKIIDVARTNTSILMSTRALSLPIALETSLALSATIEKSMLYNKDSINECMELRGILTGFSSATDSSNKRSRENEQKVSITSSAPASSTTSTTSTTSASVSAPASSSKRPKIENEQKVSITSSSSSSSSASELSTHGEVEDEVALAKYSGFNNYKIELRKFCKYYLLTAGLIDSMGHDFRKKAPIILEDIKKLKNIGILGDDLPDFFTNLLEEQILDGEKTNISEEEILAALRKYGQASCPITSTNHKGEKVIYLTATDLDNRVRNLPACYYCCDLIQAIDLPGTSTIVTAGAGTFYDTDIHGKRWSSKHILMHSITESIDAANKTEPGSTVPVICEYSIGNNATIIHNEYGAANWTLETESKTESESKKNLGPYTIYAGKFTADVALSSFKEAITEFGSALSKDNTISQGRRARWNNLKTKLNIANIKTLTALNNKVSWNPLMLIIFKDYTNNYKKDNVFTPTSPASSTTSPASSTTSSSSSTTSLPPAPPNPLKEAKIKSLFPRLLDFLGIGLEMCLTVFRGNISSSSSAAGKVQEEEEQEQEEEEEEEEEDGTERGREMSSAEEDRSRSRSRSRDMNKDDTLSSVSGSVGTKSLGGYTIRKNQSKTNKKTRKINK